MLLEENTTTCKVVLLTLLPPQNRHPEGDQASIIQLKFTKNTEDAGTFKTICIKNAIIKIQTLRRYGINDVFSSTNNFRKRVELSGLRRLRDLTFNHNTQNYKL